MTGNVVLAVCAAAFLFVVFVLPALLERRRERERTDVHAASVGLERLRGETNEELRERIKRLLRWPSPASRDGIENAFREELWRRGYPRRDVKLGGSLFGDPFIFVVRVSGRPVPLRVLEETARVVEHYNCPCGFSIHVVES